MCSEVVRRYSAPALTSAPGHDPGHAPEPGPAGYSWGELVAHLAAEHGSLAAVALRLAELAPTPEDSASVERALRRLRRRGHQDGGDYGRRLLRVFGLPRAVEARVQWMGVYHSRFSDLPLALCREQLRVWDRPPVSESRARVWLELGWASAALRGRDVEAAEVHLRRARTAPAGRAAAIERALVEAFVGDRRGDPARVVAALGEAEGLLRGAEAELPADELACLRARWIDQRAYRLNNPRDGAPDHAAALALYRTIGDDDVHPFVSYRRDAGLAFGLYRAGDPAAVRRAEAAVAHAGDGGYLRLRVMALLLLARIVGDGRGESARARARAIARRLDDEELLVRVERSVGRVAGS